MVFLPIVERRRAFSLYNSAAGIIVRAVLNIPGVPSGGAIAGIVLSDMTSAFNEYYERYLDARQSASNAAESAGGDWRVHGLLCLHLLSMSLSISSVMLGTLPLLIASNVFVTVSRRVYPWVVESINIYIERSATDTNKGLTDQRRSNVHVLNGLTGILVEVMLLVSVIPLAVRIFVIIICDFFAIFTAFYEKKHGNAKNIDTSLKYCFKPEVTLSALVHLASMSTSIASTVTANPNIRASALILSFLFRMYRPFSDCCEGEEQDNDVPDDIISTM